MSEERHFRGNVSGRIYHESEVGHKSVTEVKVIPLDAIVINGPLLPVKRHGENTFEVGGRVYSFPATAEKAEEYAADWAAIAAHLREHPPVDEAQVKALTELLDQGGADSFWAPARVADSARWLVERGVRVEHT